MPGKPSRMANVSGKTSRYLRNKPLKKGYRRGLGVHDNKIGVNQVPRRRPQAKTRETSLMDWQVSSNNETIGTWAQVFKFLDNGSPPLRFLVNIALRLRRTRGKGEEGEKGTPPITR